MPATKSIVGTARPGLALLLGGFLWLGGGTGGAVPAARAAPPGDACAVLTPARIGAAVGVAVGAGAYVTPTFKRTCTWSAGDHGAKGVVYVTLLLMDASKFEAGKQMAQMMTKVLTITPASGIGDDAYFSTLRTATGLLVKKGDLSFKIEIYGTMPVDAKEAAERKLAGEIITGY